MCAERQPAAHLPCAKQGPGTSSPRSAHLSLDEALCCMPLRPLLEGMGHRQLEIEGPHRHEEGRGSVGGGCLHRRTDVGREGGRI